MPMCFLSIMLRLRRCFCSSRLVHRHDAGAAEAQVVLQRDLRALDLALLGCAAQLVRQLVALREAGGARADGPSRAGRPTGWSPTCRRRCCRRR